MLATNSKAHPNQNDAYAAMDIVSAYLKTHKPTMDRKLKAFRKKAERYSNLAAQCDQTAQALELRLREVLPKEHHELLALYSILSIAYYAKIDDESYRFFNKSQGKAQQLLKSKVTAVSTATGPDK